MPLHYTSEAAMPYISYTSADKNCYQLGPGDIWVPIGIQAHRKLGAVIYRYGPTIGQQRVPYYTPFNPRTAAQQGWRLIYMDAVAAWQALTDDQKDDWRRHAKIIYLNGYCLFIQDYLRTHQPYARIAIVNFGIIDQDWIGA